MSNPNRPGHPVMARTTPSAAVCSVTYSQPCIAVLVAKNPNHSHEVAVYAGRTRSCQYQSRGHCRVTQEAHATNGRLAMIVTRMATDVRPPVTIPGRK